MKPEFNSTGESLAITTQSRQYTHAGGREQPEETP